MGIGDKFRNGTAKYLSAIGEGFMKVSDATSGTPSMKLDASEAAGLAKDVFARFKDRGVTEVSSVNQGERYGYGMRVGVKPGPGAEQLSADINKFIASRAQGTADIRLDWQRAAEGMVGPVKTALGSKASKVEAENGKLIIEASTTAKDLEKIRQQAEELVRRQQPGLQVTVRPFSSAVNFNANTFRDDD